MGGLLIKGSLFTMLVVIALAIIKGSEWSFSVVLPFFGVVGSLAMVFTVFVLLPLTFFRTKYEFAGAGAFIVSFAFGVSAFVFGFLITLEAWGPFAVILGLLMGGLGVLPLGMLAGAFTGMWDVLPQLVLYTLFAYGTRFAAADLTLAADREVREDA